MRRLLVPLTVSTLVVVGATFDAVWLAAVSVVGTVAVLAGIYAHDRQMVARRSPEGLQTAEKGTDGL